jgi:membrane-bound ClpP family serine protease
MSKPWYTSKLTWQNIFLTLIGVSMLVADVLTQTPVLTAPGIATLAAGIFGIVVRVWFTTDPITTDKSIKAGYIDPKAPVEPMQ